MILQQIKQLLESPSKYLDKIQIKIEGLILPEKVYIKRRFKKKMGYPLNLKNPITFNEKLQWIKIYYKNPLLPLLADKYSVREYVQKKVGVEYLIPIIKVFEDYKNIEIDELPEAFALKATHGSGWNIICINKDNLDRKKVKYLLKRYQNSSMYRVNREWSYKNITPRFICEEIIKGDDGMLPEDYKFFCFNGEPKLLQIDQDRFTDHRRNFYDISGDLLNIELTYNNYGKQFKKPDNFGKMLDTARKLSAGLPFVRVDLYSVNDRIYFGELTFYPDAGYGKFRPNSWDKLLGDWLEISKYEK